MNSSILTCSSPSLTRVGETDPLGKQRLRVYLRIKVGHLDFPAINHKHNVIYRDRGLGNVRRENDLSNARWRSVENLSLGYRRHLGVKRNYDVTVLRKLSRVLHQIVEAGDIGIAG